MASSSFPWGQYLGSGAGKFPRLKDGQTLFVVRNGNIEFPASDTRLFFWNGVSETGYLNTQPIQTVLEIANLNSSDGVRFFCVVKAELQIQPDPQVRSSAVLRASANYDQILMQATGVLQELASDYDYESFLFSNRALRNDLSSRLTEALSDRTAYFLRRALIDSVASTKEIDDQLRNAASVRATKGSVLDTEKLNADIERERIEISKGLAIAEIQSSTDVELLSDDVAAARARRNLNLRRELETSASEHRRAMAWLDEEQNDKIQRLTNTTEVEYLGSLKERLAGDLRWVIANKYPEIHKIIETSADKSNREVAVALQQIITANAFDKGTVDTANKVIAQLRLGLNAARFEISDADDDILGKTSSEDAK